MFEACAQHGELGKSMKEKMESKVVESEARVWAGRLKESDGVERRRGRTAAERRGEREEKKSL